MEDGLFLTFDDGPVPGVTDYVLNELEKRGQKATFFVVGDNVKKHPELGREILAAGHRIGNHTFSHLNGWKTPVEEYLENVRRCDEILQDQLGISTSLFRPPYGLLKKAQAKSILNSHEIIMWDVLSGDYDLDLSPEKIFEKTSSFSTPGSIVVFHDQEKTKEILPKFLPEYLDFVLERGWKTEVL